MNANGQDAGDIVAAYGEAIKRPLAFIIREPILFDADVLPFKKDVIKTALIQCASNRSLTKADIGLLGDLYFYLSYFVVGMTERENESGADFFEESRLEGEALRAEWQRAVTNAPRRSAFFHKIKSWLKPNA